MKKQALCFALLLITLFMSPVSLFSEETKPDSSTAPQVSEKSNTGKLSVKAYYFHGTRRCKTCLAIESNAKKAIETAFPNELSQGVVTWQAIDTDQKENKHYEKDYELFTNSLILVKLKDGKQVEWKNLQKVWELVGDDLAFEEYVKKELKAYLES